MSLVNSDNLKSILSNTKTNIENKINKLIDDYNLDQMIITISKEEYTNLVNNSNLDYTKFYLVYSDEEINSTKKAMIYFNNTLYTTVNTENVSSSNEVQQKITLNATSTEPIQIYTNDNSNKLMIDNYKFIAGENDVTSILKEFNNSKESSFFYNSQEIKFTNSGMNIINEYSLTNTLNSDGLYESEDINDYIEISEVK